MSIADFFRKKKYPSKEPSYTPDFIDELGEKEEPVAVSEKGSLLRTKAPSITGFNKKIVYVVGGIAATSIMFSVLFGLNDGPKNTEKKEKIVPATTSKERLSNLPANYSESSKLRTDSVSGPKQDQLGGSSQVSRQSSSSNYTPAQSSYRYSSPSYSAPRYSSPPIPSHSPGNYSDPPALPGTTNSVVRESMSKEEKEQEDALRSPIRFDGTKETDGNKENTKGNDNKTISQNGVFQIMADGLTEDAAKGDDIYLKAKLEKPKSRYEVMQGTVIPGIMITGISSDLPGQILGQVSQNVYDSVAGKYLLIPQGTKIIGSYNSKVMYGQERVMVVWNRLIFPNGYSLNLQGMQGVDLSGYVGLKDKVDNHSGKMFSSVILGSMIIAAAEIATKNDATDSWRALAGKGVSENAIQTVDKIIEKNLSVQPTLQIRPGFRFNIFVTKDIILQPYGEY